MLLTVVSEMIVAFYLFLLSCVTADALIYAVWRMRSEKCGNKRVVFDDWWESIFDIFFKICYF